MFTRLFQDIASSRLDAQTEHRLFRAMLDSIVDYGLCVLDSDGIVTSWNTAAQQLTGYEPGYVMGRQFSVIFPDEPPDSENHWLALKEARESGRFIYEIPLPARDNKRIEIIVTPVLDERSNPQGYVVLLREPVAQAESTTSPNTSMVSFELLVNSVEDYAIFMLDPNGRIVSWNIGAERLKGYRAKEVVGRHISLFHTEDDIKHERPQRNLEIAAQTGRFEGEGWRVRKDGSMFWANVVITAIRDKTGRLRGFGKVTRDLTHHYRAAIAPLPNGVLLLGADGTTFACNASASQLLDRPEKVLLGRRPSDLNIEAVRENGTIIPKDELPSQITLATGMPCHNVVLGIRSRSGITRWVSVDTGTFGPDKGGRPAAVAVSLHDISQLKDSHDAIRRGEQLFRSLVAASAQIVWEAEADGAFRNISGSFERLTGKPPEETREWGWLSSLPVADRIRVKKAWHQARQRGTAFEVECRIRLQDNTTRYFLMRGVPLKLDGHTVQEWVGTLSDIDARKRYEQELERKAHYDELTGLANRSVLTDRLEQAIAHASRAERITVVLFLDLDNFKNVNDDLGHQYGDELLRTVARRLENSVRSGDTVARIGGDEFVIVLTQLHDTNDIKRFHLKLRRALAAPIVMAGRTLKITVSIGASVSPAHGMTVTDLLRRADLAMYQVKQQGRDGLAFYKAEMDMQHFPGSTPDDTQ